MALRRGRRPVDLTPGGTPELTRETPAPGLVAWQPRRGHRFGVEVYLLADFALRGGESGRAVDLGTGSGILALLLAWAGLRVTAVERDPRWLALARRSFADSARRVELVEADVRGWSGDPVDLAVTNPPWFDPATGPIPEDDWRAVSRATLHGGPADFVRAGLRHAPRVCLVGPALPRVDGAHLSRRAAHGRVQLGEYQPGPGPTAVEPLDVAAAYRRFGVSPPAPTVPPPEAGPTT